jgi:hypothetical protein
LQFFLTFIANYCFFLCYSFIFKNDVTFEQTNKQIRAISACLRTSIVFLVRTQNLDFLRSEILSSFQNILKTRGQLFSSVLRYPLSWHLTEAPALEIKVFIIMFNMLGFSSSKDLYFVTMNNRLFRRKGRKKGIKYTVQYCFRRICR